ncbi:MAG: ROK family protein [Candidatus Hydrogenedentes bacterium]|nr:ROK family protein [Candidatus Hydrogenedentota bacterium]
MKDSSSKVIGIEIGGTKLQAVLGRPSGEILAHRRAAVDVEAGAAGILAWCYEQVQALMRTDDCAAIGIGFGGPIESKTGQVLVSHQIAGWENVPIRLLFEERFALPVVVANDANAAGWAEYCLGAGQGLHQFMYMNIGSGIGGALIIDGHLYDGQGLGACELGHTWIPDWTSPLPGAVDKLEHLCSGWSIERRIRGWKSLDLESPLAKLCDQDETRLSCALLAEAARLGDDRALQEIDRIAQGLGITLGNAVTLFHPQRIALGGGVSLMGDVLLNPLREALAQYSFRPFKRSTALVPCALEEDVVAIGALLLAGTLV